MNYIHYGWEIFKFTSYVGVAWVISNQLRSLELALRSRK